MKRFFQISSYLIISLLLITILLAFIGCPSSSPPPQPPSHPTTTPITPFPTLSVCSDKRRLCINQTQPIFFKGYSNYGIISHADPSTYASTTKLLASYGINLMREWTCSFPTSWGGLQPFTFQNTNPIPNPQYWANAHLFFEEAQKNNIWVLTDLIDRYGLSPDRPNNPLFSTHPYNKQNGGPLQKGLPDVYDSHPQILKMVRLGVRELSRHPNTIYQLVNEPIGYRNPQQLELFHKQLVQIIREEHPKALIAVNPVPDSNNRPTLPSPKSVGADFVTIHGAGVENPEDPSTCTTPTTKARLDFLHSLLKVPIISDTDGLHSPRLPCNRDDNSVIESLFRASIQHAGFNHRDTEPADPDNPPDFAALKLFQRINP